MRKGEYQNSFPVILGADCSGVVEAVQESFHEFSIGDEVLALVFGQGSNGTYAEFVSIHKYFAVKKPKNINFEQAASIPLAGLTAYRALVSSGALKEGAPAFIAGGAGGVGSFAIQLAQIFGADPIITTAGSPSTEEYLISQLGLKKQYLLNYKDLSVAQMKERVLKMNKGRHVPACFDFVGGAMKELCLEIADFSGHVASILPEKSGAIWERSGPAFQKNLSIHVNFVGAESFNGDEISWRIYAQHLRELMKLIEKGELKIHQPEIVGLFSPETVESAHQKLESGKSRGKLVMKIA